MHVYSVLSAGVYKLTDTLQPILQLRKLRFRKMKPFVQDHLWEASNPRDLRPLTHSILFTIAPAVFPKPVTHQTLPVLPLGSLESFRSSPAHSPGAAPGTPSHPCSHPSLLPGPPPHSCPFPNYPQPGS